MGTASAEGDDRARRAVDEALSSPLLEENDIKGAQHILLNITSGVKEVTMDEIFEITEFVQEEAGYGTDLIWGNCYDENLGDSISVTVIATGFDHGAPPPNQRFGDGRRSRMAESSRPSIMSGRPRREERSQGEPPSAPPAREPKPSSRPSNFRTDDLDIPAFLRKRK